MTSDDEILACEAELVHAQLTSDIEALDKLLDDSLLFTSFDGAIASKQDDLALHQSGRLRITRMKPMEQRVMHLGETSVVSVKIDASAVIDGVSMTNTLRYTRVWHKRSGGWRIVAGHMSIVPS